MPSERIQRRVDALLDEADEAVGRKDWAAVAENARAVLAINEANEDALAFLKMADVNGAGSTPASSAGPARQAAPDRARVPAQARQPLILPTAFAAGRYRVLRLLGEGGRKRVYLAHDERLGRDVALAVVKTEGLDLGGLERIQREAKAMARLGDHPGVVTVHDVGEDNGQPYIVSQYMEGGSLADLLEAAEGHRLAFSEVLRVGTEVCQALEYAHGKGIVHRDLKPSNVFLTKERSSRLGDFGLARVQDRSDLTLEGMMLGTFAYMPPEQVMGQPADARSDLYSLGCVLYEMVTGRPPFVGDDAVAVATQHLNTPPVAPSWHNQEVPRALEALVLRLLAKDPGERPESAAAVRQALAAISSTHSNESVIVTQAEANPLDRLAASVFVGREREMDELRAAMEEALSGHGRLLTLVGEPGIGKTRTALELATYARLRDAQVLWGRCYEGEGAPPYWPWVQVVRAYVHERDPKVLMSDMGPGAADIAEVVSEVRERLPGLPAAPTLEPEQARFRLFDSITTFLKNASKRQPLLLILDDLHWADKATLLLLEFLARELPGARLLVLGTYRDVELGRQHPLAQTLGQLTREQLSQRILLRGLGERDVARFIEMTAGLKPPESLVAAVYRETEGNPFFVNEVVRLLVSDGRLDHPETVESWSVAVPQGVKEVIGRRLDSLSQECNQVLSVAAVIGREFGLDALERVGEVQGDRLLEALEEAVGARVLNEIRGAVGRYSFSHALIWETLYGELSATRRVRLHQRIGDELEALYGEKAEEHAAELAHHFGQAAALGGPEKLIRYATLAGKQAAEKYAWEEATGHFETALSAKEGQPIDSETAGLLVWLGRCLYASYAVRDAWRALRQAFAYYSQAGDIQGAFEVAVEVGSNGQFIAPTQTQLLERALQIVKAESPEARTLLILLGTSVGMQGDYRRARDAFERARAIVIPNPRPASELGLLRAEAALGQFHLGNGLVRIAELIDLRQRIARLTHDLGDPHDELRELGNLMWLQWTSGDLDAAGNLYVNARALQGRQRRRDATWMTDSAWIFGLFHIALGEWESALREFEGGIAVFPDYRLLGACYLIHLLRGDFDGARDFRQRMEEASAAAAQSLGFAFLSYGLALQAYLAGNDEDAESSERAAETALAFPTYQTPVVLSSAYLGRALVAVLRNDQAAAAGVYDELNPWKGLLLVGGLHHADHILGLLALTMGRVDEAIGHFEEALAFCQKGYRPAYAWAEYDCAGALLQRGAGDDRDRARVLLDESLALARELGMRPILERALALKMQLQGVAGSDPFTSIVAVSTAVQTERPNLSIHAAPDGTVTLMFTDIENSTPLNEQMGDAKWMKLLREHNATVEREVRACGGRVVKNRGDGFMVAFADHGCALDCALALQRAFQDDEVVHVRIGLHIGNPVREGEDFFGTDVNFAARVADRALGGQVLVSARLHDLLATERAGLFSEPVEVELKGLAGKHHVYAVVGE